MPNDFILSLLEEEEKEGDTVPPVSENTFNLYEEALREDEVFQRNTVAASLKNTDSFLTELEEEEQQESEDYGFLDIAADLGVGIVEGFQEGVNNTTELIERGVNFTFGTELDFNTNFEVDIPETVAGRIGGVIGQVGEAFIPGTAAVKLLKVPGLTRLALAKSGISAQKAQRIASLVAAEGALVIGEQFAFDPEDPILSNLIQEFPNLQNPLTEFLATDPTDSEALNRFRLAAEGIGAGVAINKVLSFIGTKLSRPVADNPDLIRQADRELLGLGDSERSRQFLFEEYLLDKGLTPSQAISRVRTKLEEASIDDVVASSTGRPAAEVYQEVRQDSSVFERILARQALEGNSNIDPVLAAHNARFLQKRGELGKVIENVTGRPFQDFLDSGLSAPRERPTRGSGDPENRIDKAITLGDKIKSRFIRADLVIDNFQRKALGFGSEPAELKKALEAGRKDLANTPAVLSDKLNNTVLATAENFLAGGERFAPRLPTKRGFRELANADSLANIFGKASLSKGEATQFLRYVAAKRAEILRKRGIANPFQFDPDNAAIAARGDANEVYQQILPEYTKRSLAQLEYARRVGILSKDDVKRIVAAGKDDTGQLYYVPNFVDSESKAFKSKTAKGKGNPFKTITGNIDLPVQDLLEADARYTYSLAYKGEVNLLKQATYDLVDRLAKSSIESEKELAASYATKVDLDSLLKDRTFSKEIKEELKRRIGILTEAGEGSALNKDLAELGKKNLEELSVPELLKIIPNSDRLTVKGDNFDIVLRNGVPELYRIEDELLKEYVDFLGGSNLQALSDRTNEILGKLKKVNKVYGTLITREPSFVLVNGLRDTISAAVNSPFAFIPIASSTKGFIKTIKDKELYREALANGLTGGTRGETIGKNIAEFGKLAKGEEGKAFSNLLRKNLVTRAVRGGVDFYSELATKVEAASRLAEYSLAKEAGASPELAAHFANEVSTNFLKSGTSRGFNNFADHTVFLNASLQGFYKFFRTLRSQPQKAAVGISAYMLWDHALDNLSRDFEEYALIDEDTKSLHTVIPNPINMDGYIDWVVKGRPEGSRPALDPEVPFFVLPIPYDYGATAKLLSNTVRNLVGEEAATPIHKALGRYITTLGPAVGFPTFIRPFWEFAVNKDSFGRDLVPTFYEGERDIEHLYRANTNNFAVWISDQSKKLDGIFREGEGEAFVHPLVAEHFINNLTPGLASYVRGVLDRVSAPEEFGAPALTPEGVKSRTVNPAVFALDSVKSRFLLGQAELRAGEPILFDLKNIAEDILKARKNLAKRTTEEIFKKEITGPTGEERKLEQVYPTVRSMSNFVTILGTKQQEVLKDPTLSEEMKKQRIGELERLKNQKLIRFLGWINKVDPNRDLERITKR